MLFSNRIIIAAAGAGKTTRIARSVNVPTTKKILVVTYTLNNEEEIRKKIFKEYGVIPSHVKIKTWFTFLLEDFVRPYQNILYDEHRIDGLVFVDGISAQYTPEHKIKAHYFYRGTDIYSDKVSKFGFKVNELSGGFVIGRLQQIYDTIYIDEVQDLAAWDLDILELLLNSSINTVFVGDPRQATYKTNNGAKYAKYGGSKIVDRFNEWVKQGLCEQELMSHSHRCNQPICNFADKFFPNMGATESRNTEITGHDGVFIVRSGHIAEYVHRFAPKILRYSKIEKCAGLPASNFKESKGLTFPRVLIFPHKPLRSLLADSDFSVLKEPAALYVATTRARFSVGIVYDGDCVMDEIHIFNP